MASIRLVSRTTIHLPEKTERSRWELTVTEVATLPLHYIQMGLLFPKPSTAFDAVAQGLQTSLSHCLLHFPFLSGRLATDAETTIFVDCNDAGAQFVVAKADGLHASDLMNAVHVPLIVRSFFPMDGAINYDGYTLPLVAVQVTELEDGVFIGCSLNHAMADGESFWHFFNSWSELNAGRETISRPPLIERAQIHKELGQVRFPLSEHRIERFKLPALRERIFCFSAQSIARIKAKANERSKLQRGEISSLQALVGLMWRTITRARKLQADQTTACKLAAGLRKRVDPTLPREYFGSCMLPFLTEAKVGELLGQDLGWAAQSLHETVLRETTNMGRQRLMNIQLYGANGFESSNVRVANSQWFEMYGSDFGWGKGLAVLSGSANKFDGDISVLPGKGEGGSMDLEVCLLPHVMAALELDEELLDVLLHS
ncbi:putative acetyltransferase [Nymphaea thermarum]|nr:putative acetyltransferase [Nymphaea thermarum]